MLLNFELKIELKMLLKCCLIHKSIIILRHFLYLLYLCPYLDLGSFFPYLCDLFFAFIFIFIMINRMNTDTLAFLLFFRICPIILDDNVDEECESFWNGKGSASRFRLANARFFANFSLALLINSLLIKKAFITYTNWEVQINESVKF